MERMMGGLARVVLVVEDDSLVRENVVCAFQDAGWEVWAAGSGESALALLRQATRAVDTVFTDIQLNGSLSGWDVAIAVRQASPDAAIIYTSGNSVDRMRQVANSLFFAKPYDPAAIIAAAER
jgi:CheY-like chemotaxis protein